MFDGTIVHQVSSKRTLFLLLCFGFISSTVAVAPVRMSRAAQRRRQQYQSDKALEKIESNNSNRRLLKHVKKLPHPHPRHSHNNTNSCLDYTCDELEAAWTFAGDIPDCPGLNCNFNSGSGGSGSGGSGGGGSSSDDDGSGGDDVTQDEGTDDANGDDTTEGDDTEGDDAAEGDDAEGDDAYEGDDEKDNAVLDFDITNCTTYSEYWLWDLALTCENSSNLTNCECTSAAVLMSQGYFSCPDGDNYPYCPSGCKICETCLTLLGCPKTRPTGIPDGFSMNLLLYILAAVAGILLGIIAMVVHQKDQPEKPLEENLVDPNAPGAANSDDNVWLAPVS